MAHLASIIVGYDKEGVNRVALAERSRGLATTTGR
jgi:hypothetical protein